MSHRVDVFLFGENVEPDWNHSEEFVQFHSGSKNSLKQITAELLNGLVAQSEADYVAFKQQNIPLSICDVNSAVTGLDDQPGLAAVQIRHVPSDDPFDIYQSLPSSVGILARAPEWTSTVFFRQSSLRTHPLCLDVGVPIWDRLIQHVLDNGTTIGSQLSDTSDADWETFLADAQPFPVLAPDIPGRENNWLLAHLQNVQPEQLVSPITSHSDAIAINAGLLLIHDFLDESHNLSQSIQGKGRNSVGLLARNHASSGTG